MINSIYIDGLGHRNPITEKDQIIWFFEQTMKNKTKSVATRFWLDVKELYAKRLVKMEAYELLDYIQKKSTTAQEIRRSLSRIKSKSISDKEHENFMKTWEESKANRELIKLIRLN